MAYHAPTRDMSFILNDVLGLQELGFPDLGRDLVDAVLEEGGKLASEVLAPLNGPGDREGCRLESDGVRTARGFAQAYRQWVEGGWASLAATPDFGGQGLPLSVAVAAQEMWNAANISFGLCPLLSQGAVEALTTHGSQALKDRYLAKLISGEWTGTMNLTEPQAGSDLNALKAKAIPLGEGRYAITGTKIFITYGDHDMAENIVHLVLARLPDAPAGTRGISLFLVPKFLVNADGSLGERNDAHCIGIEEKLGIHASPTCVMSYGEKGGATGWLIGEENRGLACMFTMMNNARLLVGTQGVALADRATQHALAYARDRKQGRAAGTSAPAGEMSPIIEHADIRRTLMTMKALTQAARMICYATGVALDQAHIATSAETRESGKTRADLLTPIAKSFSTDIAVEVASMGVQIRGGMGYIEETGAAQFLRDARILPIYEGANGIQAIDLVTRKLPLGNGAVVSDLMEEIAQTARDAAARGEAFLAMGEGLADACKTLEDANVYMAEQLKSTPQNALAGASPYLRLFGTVLGAHFLIRAALVATSPAHPAAFAKTRLVTAQFYADNILPAASGLAHSACAGAETLYALDATALAS